MSGLIIVNLGFASSLPRRSKRFGCSEGVQKIEIAWPNDLVNCKMEVWRIGGLETHTGITVIGSAAQDAQVGFQSADGADSEPKWVLSAPSRHQTRRKSQRPLCMISASIAGHSPDAHFNPRQKVWPRLWWTVFFELFRHIQTPPSCRCRDWASTVGLANRSIGEPSQPVALQVKVLFGKPNSS